MDKNILDLFYERSTGNYLTSSFDGEEYHQLSDEELEEVVWEPLVNLKIDTVRDIIEASVEDMVKSYKLGFQNGGLSVDGF